MKKIILAFLLFFAWSPFHCKAGDHMLSASAFNTKLHNQKGIILIDIRTPEEYQSGFIRNSLNLDWNNNFEDYIQEMDTSKTILFYGKSAEQVTEAAKLFAYKGFKNAYGLQGGLPAWKKAKYPLLIPKTAVNAGMSKESYQSIIQSKDLVLVDFNAPWCKPCRLLSPILDSVAEENKAVLFLQKIDIDQNKPLAKYMQIYSLPLIILYKNGKEVWRKDVLINKEALSSIIQTFKK